MLIRRLCQYACAAAMTLVVPTLVAAAPPSSVEQASYLPEPAEPAVQPQCNDGVCRVANAPLQAPCHDGACYQRPLASGPCRDGLCPPGAGYGNACNVNGCPTGMCPSAATSPWYPTGDCYAGKPYTFGDLACDMRAAKSSCNEANPWCQSSGCCGLHSWWCNEKYKMHCRQQYRNQVLGAHLHNKFNYFCPSGNGGEGVPLAGCYRRVYATNPGHYDVRDKQVYAAAANGVPNAVPLAPGVRYQYNYGWGTPSSRITEISTISPPRY